MGPIGILAAKKYRMDLCCLFFNAASIAFFEVVNIYPFAI
jgi:hypothetical protein